MPDAYHVITGDLEWSSNGDLQTVSSVQESQQRILRRLLTNPGDYIWQPSYGAGLPAQIGQVTDEVAVESLITTQMYLEASVVQNPRPQVDFTTFFGGITANIRYIESDSNQPTTLSFSATS
jgi:phage baseplate assembly protein W